MFDDPVVKQYLDSLAEELENKELNQEMQAIIDGLFEQRVPKKDTQLQLINF